jgi:uncharacterized protein (DUF1697 family)
MATHTAVVLIRGINVGSSRKVPMASLRALCEEAGCTDVRTYIQSGNVVLDTSLSDAQLAEAVAAGIESSSGFRPSVMVRRPAALRRILDSEPFGPDASDDVHVGFLSRKPSKAAVAAVADVDISPESFEVRGTELLLHLPNGMGRSKFARTPFAKLLGVDVTVRNLRTVKAVYELATIDL